MCETSKAHSLPTKANMPKKNKQKENLKTKQGNKENGASKPKGNQSLPKDDNKREQAGMRINQARNLESTPNLESIESVTERGKFKRRIIESNWAKYEEEAVSDEECSMNKSERPTTTDFQSLISQSGKEISSFKFKEEHEFETDQNDHQRVKIFQPSYSTSSNLLGTNDEILSINLNSLSSTLKDIPIYQKLFLQHTLDMLDDKGLEWYGHYFQSLKETNIENLIVETNEHESHATAEWRFDDTDIETNVKQLLGRMRTEQKSTTNEYDNKNRLFDDKSASPCETVRSLVLLNEDISTIPANSMVMDLMISQPTSSNLKNVEDELEVLLSITKPDSKGKDTQTPSKKNDCCRNLSETNLAGWNPSTEENIDIENEVRQVGEKNPELESTQKPAKEKVFELEDWLDSMLE